MLYLFLVSLLWAFSFGLIKGELTGLPPASVAFVRLLIASHFVRCRRFAPASAFGGRGEKPPRTCFFSFS
jgi:drug/metabolite transporter (DMT)-like permease